MGVWWILGKHFLPPDGCGSVFHAKNYGDSWRHGRWLARGHVNMADEAKLCSPICSTFEVLVVWCVIGIVIEKNWALSINQCWLKALQFWHISLICWMYFSYAVVSMGFRKLQWIREAAACQRLWLLFGTSLALGSALGLLLGRCQLYKTFHCISQSMKQFAAVAYNKRRWHFKMMIF